MPYPYNEPRWEFTHADRTNLDTIAQACETASQQITYNQLQNNNYNYQIIGPTFVQRGNFDNIASMINALVPTYNAGGTPPLPDVIP